MVPVTQEGSDQGSEASDQGSEASDQGSGASDQGSGASDRASSLGPHSRVAAAIRLCFLGRDWG